MEKIITACLTGEINMFVACVIASSLDAGGIQKALKLGIAKEDILVINPNDFRVGNNEVDQDGFGSVIVKELKKRGVTVVTQNGWMPLTPEPVIDAFSGAIFNQHPGPVPEFGGKGMYGKRVHAAVLRFREYTGRDFETEVIAQRVDKEFDKGAVVNSERVPIVEGDTVDTLQQRALLAEHRVQIGMLKALAEGTLKEQPAREVIVFPGEEEILVRARRQAKKDYPNG